MKLSVFTEMLEFREHLNGEQRHGVIRVCVCKTFIFQEKSDCTITLVNRMRAGREPGRGPVGSLTPW